MAKSKQVIKPKTASNRPNGLGQYLTVERIIIGGSLLLTVAIIGIVSLNAWLNRPIAINGIQRIAVMQGHQETPVKYEQIPPAGGVHYPVWQNCGIYNQPLIDELAVHSLEHGAVWITYNPTIPQEQLETLRNLAKGGSHRLLSPYIGLPSPVVVSAWSSQLSVDSADDERLAQFVRQYEKNPQAPEPGALCTQGESRTR